MYSEEAIKKILTKNPKNVFYSRDITKATTYSSVQVKRTLLKLYKKGFIFRSRTQLNEGYIYAISKKSIHKKYACHLLPYKLKNKKLLIQKIIKNRFNKPSKNERINIPKDNLFVNKYSSEYFKRKNVQEQLTSLVAFVMGDGHIKNNKEEIQFYFKEKRDAIKFKEEFLSVFSKDNMVIKEGRFCYYCSVCSKELSRLLISLGAPKGRKVGQKFLIPRWILRGSNNIKISFLSTIIGNEGSKPQDGRWRIQFVLSKEERHVESLLDLLNQIRGLLFQFNISTTHIQLRKQPGRNYCGRFYIKGKENIHKFYNYFEFLYASEKQEVLESLIKSDSLKCNSTMTA